jgi:4-amino-4-deoxy-L-arabinose transferase-like glycosyltransferase
LARQVLSGQVRNPFVMGYMSMPTFFYWPLSWSLRLVGNTMAGLRFPAALVGTATVPLLYFLARDLWGRRLALLSALFLAAYDYHIHYSRLGANNIWDPFFVLLALWLLHRGLVARPSRGAVPLEQMEIASPQDVILAKAGMTAARNDVENQGPVPAKAQGPVPGAVLAGPTVLPGSEGCRFLLAAGLVLGLSFYFYTGARLLPLLMAAYVAFVWLQNRLQVRRLRRQPVEGLGRHLALLVAAFVVVAGPMLGYALTHPDEWNARINQVGIIQSGWLAREPGLTGKSTLQILAEQFLRSAGAFHVFPDRTAWYGSPRPLLGFVAGAFALLGLAWALAHWRERRHFLVLIWFWSVIITGGMLTESPPSSQRLVIAIPAVALFVALGLEQTARLARRLLGADRLRIRRIEIGPISIGPVKGENLALGLIVALMAVSSVRFYFVDFSRSGRYGSQNGETATMIGHYLQELDGGYQAYFFGAPRIYWSFGTMTFLAPDVPGQDVVEPLAAPPAFGEEGRQAVYIFLPERSGELDWVQQAYPGGTRRDFYDATGTVRFTVYRVSTPIHTP